MNWFLRTWVIGLLLLGGGLAAVAEPGPTNSVAAGPEALPADYYLHPGDLVEVRIYGEDDLTSKVRLNENGEVVLPLLAPLSLGGLTVQQANGRVREAYMTDYLVNPVVTVSILEYGNSRVSVLGEVRSPGIYRFPANEKLNLIQAIALAGGYTRIGQPSRVTIKRGIGGTTTVIRLDAKAMAEKEKTAIFEVRPDDIINVGETIF